MKEPIKIIQNVRNRYIHTVERKLIATVVIGLLGIHIPLLIITNMLPDHFIFGLLFGIISIFVIGMIQLIWID